MILFNKGSHQPSRIDLECKHASVFGRKNEPFARALLEIFIFFGYHTYEILCMY